MDANGSCRCVPPADDACSDFVYATDAAGARKTSRQGLNPKALARARAFIEAHIGESFTLGDLAAAACISRFHFARLFRVSTGRSPMEYVLQVRIERAKKTLAEGQQKISAAAAEFGFFDQSHFTRSFRRMTGLSPREFMRMHLDNSFDASPRQQSAASRNRRRDDRRECVRAASA